MSAADERNLLDSRAVNALANELHLLNCVVIGAPVAEPEDRHQDLDRTRARFLLVGLREHGWELSQ